MHPQGRWWKSLVVPSAALCLLAPLGAWATGQLPPAPEGQQAVQGQLSGQAGQAGQTGGAGAYARSSAELTGSVSGRVVFGDTQQPARFSQVVLIPVQNVQTDSSRPGIVRGFVGFGGSGGNARTDLDGNFVMTNVTTGDYYVAGQAAGYISETMVLQARVADGADAQALLASLPTVHVTAGSMATANVSLTRGGTVAGRIQWEDGSPAAGVQVSGLMMTAGTSTTAAVNQSGGRAINIAGAANAMSDDRGMFRITGLAPGTYVVRATLMAPSVGGNTNFMQRTQALTIYAPGKLRRSDAQSITLHQGEERDDLQWVIDLHALHTVTGRVGATSGPEPESGSVRLVDTTDSTLNRTAAIASDGTFTLSYVPSGNYTLSVNGASSNPMSGNGGRRGGQASTTPGTTYQQYSGSLSVADTDVSGVSINLTPNSSQ
ncbi:hypothetical protein SAMN05421819_2254 [Bryocella elongata]|uniref:Carboxypeptidase regulatory-like domain-containing protein n=2 Tax=Bryocella elongata TaxID=863522 RepID=A0A1H5YDG4_9BACT|nr:hypothetical protein SAMN05421819_2254 [Bryocella elongata]